MNQPMSNTPQTLSASFSYSHCHTFSAGRPVIVYSHYHLSLQLHVQIAFSSLSRNIWLIAVLLPCFLHWILFLYSCHFFSPFNKCRHFYLILMFILLLLYLLFDLMTNTTECRHEKIRTGFVSSALTFFLFVWSKY